MVDDENTQHLIISVLREKGMFVIEPNFLSRGWEVRTEVTIESNGFNSVTLNSVTTTPMYSCTSRYLQ